MCTETAGPVPTSAGYAMSVTRGLSALASADTVIIPCWLPVEAPLSARVRRTLLRAHARWARRFRSLVGTTPGAYRRALRV